MLDQDQTSKLFTLRMPPNLRSALEAKAKRTRRTLTSLVLEGVEKVVLETEDIHSKSSFSEHMSNFIGAGRKGRGLDEKGVKELMQIIRGDD